MPIPTPRPSGRRRPREYVPQAVRPENEGIHGRRQAERLDEVASLSTDLSSELDVVAEALTLASLVAFAANASQVMPMAPALTPGSFSTPTATGDSSYVASAQQNAAANPARADLDGLAENTYNLKMAAAEAFGIKPGSIGGRAYRPYRSDHTTGHAIDIPGSGDRGDQIAAWVIARASIYKVKYVIFNSRIWYPGKGWQVYNPSKGVTGFSSDALHQRHVHVSTY